MKPLLIDCDPGIDDAVTICLAHKEGTFELVGLTAVSGNLTADRCGTNARLILDLLGAGDVPVCEGPMRPLVRPYPRDPFFHGDNGLANLDFPDTRRAVDPRFAPDFIIEMANRHEGELAIAALGPLTNLALAVIKDPSLPKKVASVSAIAGAFGFGTYGTARATGDNPASEWNVYVDPEAAQIVFEAGFNLTAIGLDVATRPELTLDPGQRQALRDANAPTTRFLLGVLDFVERRGFGAYCGLIDSTAVAHLINPTLFRSENVRVVVERQLPVPLHEGRQHMRHERGRIDHLVVGGSVECGVAVKISFDGRRHGNGQSNDIGPGQRSETKFLVTGWLLLSGSNPRRHRAATRCPC